MDDSRVRRRQVGVGLHPWTEMATFPWSGRGNMVYNVVGLAGRDQDLVHFLPTSTTTQCCLSSQPRRTASGWLSSVSYTSWYTPTLSTYVTQKVRLERPPSQDLTDCSLGLRKYPNLHPLSGISSIHFMLMASRGFRSMELSALHKKRSVIRTGPNNLSYGHEPPSKTSTVTTPNASRMAPTLSRQARTPTWPTSSTNSPTPESARYCPRPTPSRT